LRESDEKLAHRTTDVRIFALDAGDWSMLFAGIALAGFLMVLS
jgi:hypothetical protein